MRSRSQERIGTLVLVAFVAAWPLVFVFLLNRAHFSADAAPAYVAFFILFWLIWLVPLVLLIRSAHRELSYALEQRTAAAEILHAISKSPNDAQPVFETIVRNAVVLCDSLFANVFRFDGELLHYVTSHNVGPEYAELVRTKYPMRPDASQVSGRVLLTKSVVRIEDAITDPDYDQRFPRALGWRRMLGVPMLQDGNPIGVIVVGWATPGPITEAQEELLKTFADQAVIAIENARLFDEVQARTRELSEALEQQTATAEILGVISSSLSEAQPVFNAIVRAGLKLFPGAAVSIEFPTAEGEITAVAIAAEDAAGAENWRKIFPFPLSREYIAGVSILDRRVVDIADAREVSEELSTGRRNFLKSGYRAVTKVPMLQGDAAIGVLSVARPAPGSLSEKQLAILKTFAHQAVIAIENTRLLSELRQRTRELSEALEYQTATSDVLNVISRSPTELQPVLDTIVNTAARLCSAEYSFIARLIGGTMQLAAEVRVDAEHRDYLTSNAIVIDRGSVTGRVAIEKRTIHVPDVLADPEFDRFEWQKVGKQRTVLGVPLLREGELIGTIILARREVAPFTERQIDLVTTFANQAVIAIENARLFDEAQARAHDLGESLRQQTATADVLKVISRSTFDLQTVLDTLVEAAARLCEADGAAMARERGGVQYQVAYFGAPTGYSDFIRDIPLAPGRGSVVGRVLLTRKPVQIADASTDAEFTHHNIREYIGFRTLLGVPLLREGHPIGVFVLWRRAVQPFNERQVELVTTFADQAVIAIENTRLFDEIQDKTRQLEIADKYKSHFLASASHDLRQPLHALNLFVAQLDGERDPAERDRIVTRIDAAVSSMNELFESLLDMAKLEAGILEPHVTDFPLQRVFKNIETTFADVAKQKGLRLVVVPSNAWVRSDIILFERILMNLVSNAVRYTPKGRIVVGCRRRGEVVRVDVHDSGPGIPEGQQKSVFGEYYRLDAAEPDRGAGFGLGLAIVDRLGRLLNHTVELESILGRGSRFSISAPVTGRRISSTESPAVAALSDPAQGKMVVVIDDDALVLDGMGGMLRSWGCEVLTADSDETALAKIAAQTKRPDLIISDYRLTNGRTGIEAVERLRRAQGVSIPAFLISGDTAPERLRDASENGFHLLHKPVAPIRLRAVLNQLLLKPSAPRGAAPAGE